MAVATRSIHLQTRGNGDVVDITESVAAAVADAGIQNGTISIFSPSATSALTTLEYETGCISDLRRLFDEIAAPARHYAHNARWGDGNGHSHVRAALLGTSARRAVTFCPFGAVVCRSQRRTCARLRIFP